MYYFIKITKGQYVKEVDDEGHVYSTDNLNEAELFNSDFEEDLTTFNEGWTKIIISFDYLIDEQILTTIFENNEQDMIEELDYCLDEFNIFDYNKIYFEYEDEDSYHVWVQYNRLGQYIQLDK